uniref:Uncharacterized protein n=1 Tax=Meloidogyne enterolobii TaxID=390850 RepID=A0A6V7YD00_MELEN|nr:unnamed protein product [Meloidogyne enterolobii]
MVDLLTKYTTSVDFIIGIKNGNGLEHCLKPTTTYPNSPCKWYRFSSCGRSTEYRESSYANTLPFIYSRTVAEFQSMRYFQPATGDGCPGSCGGNTVCRKWTGLAAGFAKNDGKLLRTVAGIGDPGGSYCGLANSVGENDVSYKITVDNGNMHWFQSEGCAWKKEGFQETLNASTRIAWHKSWVKKLPGRLNLQKVNSHVCSPSLCFLKKQPGSTPETGSRVMAFVDRNVTRSTSNFQAVHSSCWCPAVVLHLKLVKLLNHHHRQHRVLHRQYSRPKVEEVWESSSS